MFLYIPWISLGLFASHVPTRSDTLQSTVSRYVYYRIERVEQTRVVHVGGIATRRTNRRGLPRRAVEAVSKKRARGSSTKPKTKGALALHPSEQTARMSMLRQLNLVWRERRAVLLRSCTFRSPCLSAAPTWKYSQKRRADLFPRLLNNRSLFS